nr:MAG TPA: hypothetical protein [Caudoviricetes sp.]
MRVYITIVLSYGHARFRAYLFWPKSNKSDCKMHHFQGNRRNLW